MKTYTITLPLIIEMQEKDGELKVDDAYVPVEVGNKFEAIDIGGLKKDCRGNFRRYLNEDFQELLRKELER